MQGRLTRKNRARAKAHVDEESYQKTPHSFIIHKGKVGKCVRELKQNFRGIMEPNTAVKLKVNFAVI